MAMRVYADVSDYDEVAEEPSELDEPTLLKRLRAASSEVDGLTRLAIYDTDDDDFATDQDTAEAFTVATCQIVEFWGITDDPTGAEAGAGAIRIGSVSLGTTGASQVKQTARDKLVARIGEPAVITLGNAGLLSGDIAY
jgi:hypothetical protein